MFGPIPHRAWKRQLGPIAVSLTMVFAVWATGPSLGQDQPAVEKSTAEKTAPEEGKGPESVFASLSLVYDADRELLIAGVHDDLEDAPRANGYSPFRPLGTEREIAPSPDVDDIERELLMGLSDLESPSP